MARRGAFSLLRQWPAAVRAAPERFLLGGGAILAILFCSPTAAARLLPEAAPSVTYSLTGTSGDDGWFTSNVTVHWSVSPTQGLVRTTGCEPAVLLNSDSTGVTRECVAEWSDGTTITKRTVPAIKIDKTPPANVAGTPARAANANGWDPAPVGVSFGGTDATSGIATCTATTYGGPDGADRSISGTCRDNAGNVASAAHLLDYDATAPAVTGRVASRQPDRNGWYNDELTVNYTGSDATSGIASCDTPVYGGPDDATASVSGVCRDRRNTSASSAFAFRYDETAPAVSAAADRAPNAAGWYRAPVTVTFSQSDPVSGPTHATRRGTTAGRTARRFPSPGHAVISPATSAAPPAASSTTRLPRRPRAAIPGDQPMGTGGSTTRSPSPSRATTRPLAPPRAAPLPTAVQTTQPQP